jgi:hypothetical protein
MTIAYIRIQRNFVSVRILASKGSGGFFEDIPQFAYHSHSKKEVAFGSAASAYADSRGYDLAQVFNHPRVVIHDIDNTERVLRYFIDQALHAKRTSLFLRPRFVIHIIDTWEGGITDIEKEALKQLSERLRAKGMVLCEGPDELTEPEVYDLVANLNGSEYYEAT